MPSTPESLLDVVPVVPVVVLEDLAHAVPVARALAEGGLPVVELTLRTPVALDAIRAIAAEVPEVLVGAGTVVSPAQASQAVAAGASFLVSPGSTPTIVEAMRATGVPFLPGTATVSEVMAALELGCTDLKLFPAEVVGGTSLLKALGSVLPQARFCPTGGITAQTVDAYRALPNVPCVGGSWLTPADALRAEDWGRVRDLAAQVAGVSRTAAAR